MAGLLLGLTALGALIATAIAGCGGASKSAANPASSSSSRGNELQAYINCLDQHGVHITLPSGAADRTGRPTAFPSRSRSTDRPTVRPSAGRSGFPGGGFPGGGGFGALGNTPPSGVDQATWEAAQQACASVRPSFGGGNFRGGGDNGANAAYRNCLQNHGVTGSMNNLSTGDPKVAAAVTACAPLSPTPTATG
jgi:hypothetical protein